LWLCTMFSISLLIQGVLYDEQQSGINCKCEESGPLSVLERGFRKNEGTLGAVCIF
jgi:hypothetical protein